MATNKEIKELLPTSKLKPMYTLHRIKIGTPVFIKLEEIRRKYRLWDREAAIIWLLKECDEWIEEEQR